MHLKIEDLVDIAEGARAESDAPHLASCEPCRVQLDELRAMMTAATDVEVPEPSPLFWDHLSARVSAAVEQDARLKPSRDNPAREITTALATLFGARAFQASVAALALVALAVVIGSRTSTPIAVAPAAPAAAVAEAAPAPEPLSVIGPDGDASLTLVASLTDDVDLETAREAGLAPRGSAEHAVTHLSEGELRELRRLLNEELARSGG